MDTIPLCQFFNNSLIKKGRG